MMDWKRIRKGRIENLRCGYSSSNPNLYPATPLNALNLYNSRSGSKINKPIRAKPICWYLRDLKP